MDLSEHEPRPAQPEHLSVEQLNAFVLGQLDDDASAEIERHLTTCDACAARVETPPADPLVSLFRQAQSLVLPDEPKPPAEKYDFLAPPQQPDELGRLGPYRVLEVIGSGGMGIVFVAEDPDLQRRVALKVMKPELAGKLLARERFLREARSMAKLSHPRVVTIHQVGQERGVPFLAMELLEGESLDTRLKREDHVPIAEARRIGLEIAEGLAAAHQHGLIHRDIKPSNIWIEDKTGLLKILDFGLARRNDDEEEPLTLLDAIVGTPAYMSPEQARGDPVDHRGDLFGLGCVLYQLVTGVLPFRGSNPLSVLAAVVTTMPPPVRERNPEVPPAFAEVITRLLAKQPQDRYPDAQAVLAALQSVDAEIGSSPRKTRDLSHRTFGLLLVVFIGIVSALGHHFAGSRLGTSSGAAKEVSLAAVPGHRPEIAVLPERPPVEMSLGDGRLCHWSGVEAVTFSRDSKWIASAGMDHMAIVWDAATGQPRLSLCNHTKELLCIAFDRDGKRLATGAKDNTVKIWDAEQGKLLRDLPMNDAVHTAAFSPDGRLLGAMTSTALRLWEVDSGKEMFAVNLGASPSLSMGQGFAFRGDGRMLAHRRGAARVCLIDTQTWRECGGFSLAGGTVGCLAFAPESKLLAVSSRGGEPVITLWDVESGAERYALRHEEPADSLVGLAFSPDGRYLAAAFDWKDGRVRQWELATGNQRPEIAPTLDPPGFFCLAYSPDGAMLAASGRDGVVRRWDACTGVKRALPGGSMSYVRAMSLSPDGNSLAVGCSDLIRLLDVPSGVERRQIRGHHHPIVELAFSPDGGSLASSALEYEVRLWDARTGAQRYDWRHFVRSLAFRRDGKILAGSRWGLGALKLWDLRTGAERLKLEQNGLDFSNCLAVSPDGTILAAGLYDQPPILWDVGTGLRKRSLTSLPGNGSAAALAFSPDGKTLAVAHNGRGENLCGLWAADTGEPRVVLTPLNSEISSLAFRPDGAWLATAGLDDGVVRLWDASNGHLVRTYQLGPAGAKLLKIEFSSNGQRLAVLNGNGTVFVLRLNEMPH